MTPPTDGATTDGARVTDAGPPAPVPQVTADRRGRAGRATARPARRPPARVGRRVGGRAHSAREIVEVSILLAPAVGLFLLFVIFPMMQAAYYSLYSWNGYGPLENFVGFANYLEALGHNVFQNAVRNNLLIVVLSLAIQLPLGLGIALLLNRKFPGRTAVRLLIFVPYVLAEVVAGIVWRLMLQPRGLADGIAAGLGVETRDLPLWLADPDLILWTLLVVLTWKYIGFAILLFLAGLQGVPEELHEAAALDGAGWWSIQRRITVPLLGPTIRIWAFLSMIGSMQLFDMVWILTNGNPGPIQTMATYLIGQGVNRQRIGYGSAAAVIMFSLSFVLALVYQRLVLRRDLQEDR